MLAFPCPRCGVRLQVAEHCAGKPVRCGGCGSVIQAPRLAAAGAAVGAPRAADGPPTLPPDRSGPRGSESLAGADQEAYEFLAPPQGDDELGRLGPYRILRVLGRGSMGVVFAAEHTQLGRLVALKVLLPVLAASPGARQRFQREARAAAALSHERVVLVFEVGEDRGLPFLAMPLLRGETLEARLGRAKRLPIREVLRIGREVAEGLAAVHARGLVHRDIKPSNIWLEDGGESRAAIPTGGHVKLLDFGLARAADGDTQLTQSGALLGTPGYLAPEQTRGGPPDPRSDLFALGCVLYRACTGELPFRGRDTLATLAALATETPAPVRARNPEVPPAFSDLVARLLAKDPEGRPPSAGAVVEALAALEQGRTPARPTPPPARRGPASQRAPATVPPDALSKAPLPPPVTPVVLDAEPAPELVLPVRKRTGCVLAAVAAGLFGVAALVLGITGVVFLTEAWHSRPGQAPGRPRPPALVERRPSKAPFAAIQAAVKGRRYTATKVLGGAFTNKEYEEVPPEGGILVGFEVGTEPFFDTCVVSYLRPIYLTDAGEKLGIAYGRPTDRTRTVKGKPGFAVGALHVHAGGLLDGFSVTFMEIGKTELRRSGAYRSEWIGGTGGGDQGEIGDDGSFVVGIRGKLVDSVKPGSIGFLLVQLEPERP
jgi:serine/threonine protein kinase